MKRHGIVSSQQIGNVVLQVGRLVDDLLYGRDYVEPDEVKVGIFMLKSCS